MSDPALPLQAAIVTALKSGGGIAGVGARVYDEPPVKAAFPYVVVGDCHVVGDDNDCADASEVFSQVHAWSRASEPDYWSELKTIAGALRDRLRAEPVLAGFIVTVVQFEQVQYLRDPDGLTRHAVIEHRYLITHTS
jgi:hypothetical protein